MLPGPMEILELSDGESYSFHVLNFQIDEGIIRPARAPGGKAIRILRVHVPATDKPTFPFYWDITGQGAVAQMLPLLENRQYQGRTFTLRASGAGPKKRYALEVSP